MNAAQGNWWRRPVLGVLTTALVLIGPSARLALAFQGETGTNDFRISDMGADGDPAFGAAHTDVAYNSADDLYLVVWSGDDTTDGELEIFGQLIDASTNLEIGTDFRISDMGVDGDPASDAVGPVVSYNSADNQFLVAWIGDDGTGALIDDEFEVFGQLLTGSSGIEIGSNDFRISDVGPDAVNPFNPFHLSVAYNPQDNEFLVVWGGIEELVLGSFEREVFGQRIDGLTGAEIGTNDFRISDMGPDGDPTYTAITTGLVYNAVDNQYLVVWNGSDDAGTLVSGELEAFGQLLDAAGAEVGANDFRISDMGPDGDASFGAFFVVATHNSNNNEYLVAWNARDDSGTLANGETEIFGQLLDVTGAEIGANDFRISESGPDGDPSFAVRQARAAYIPATNAYLVVWRGEDDSPGDGEEEIFGQIIDATGAQVCEDDMRISDMGPDGDVNFDAGSAFEGPSLTLGAMGSEVLVAWEGDDTTDGEFEVFGQRIFVLGTTITVIDDLGTLDLDDKQATVETGDLVTWCLPSALVPDLGSTCGAGATQMRITWITNPTDLVNGFTVPITALGAKIIGTVTALGGTYTYDLELLDASDNVVCVIDPEIGVVNPGVTNYCAQANPTSVPGCFASLWASDMSLASGSWNTTNIPRSTTVSNGTTLGIYIYTRGVGIGQSTFSATVPYGTLCLQGFKRSAPACAPATLATVAGVCNSGLMSLSPNCNAGALGIAVGDDVNVQFWYRDPTSTDGGQARFSNAIFYTVQ